MRIEKVFSRRHNEYRWMINGTIAGKRIRRADFEHKRDAEEAVAEMRSQARAARYGLEMPRPKITLGQLLEKAEKDQLIKAKRDALRVFRIFVNLIGKDTKLTSLTKSDWKKYGDYFRDRKCEPGTINRYQANVSSVLRYAHILFPELDGWRPPKGLWAPRSEGRNRILSIDEVVKLFAACRAPRQRCERDESIRNRAEIYDLFRLMLLTCAREGEILNLQQSRVSRDWGHVLINSKKGRYGVPRSRVIPLSNLAIEILEKRKNYAPGYFKLGTTGLYRALVRIGKISGIAYGDRVENGWICYDMRHLAATVMESNGIPYSAVAAILGHHRQDQTATYTHAQGGWLQKGVKILEDFVKNIDQILAGQDSETMKNSSIG